MITLLLFLSLLSKGLPESGALYLRQHPFKQACNEATNCGDICNSDTVLEGLQQRHCFKGNCINDALIDCEVTFQVCKDGVPDDYCS